MVQDATVLHSVVTRLRAFANNVRLVYKKKNIQHYTPKIKQSASYKVMGFVFINQKKHIREVTFPLFQVYINVNLLYNKRKYFFALKMRFIYLTFISCKYLNIK